MTEQWKALGRDRRDKVGSKYKRQRNVYAMRVTLAIMGGLICPSCKDPFDMSNAQAYDVDKVIPALDYVPGNIVTICRECNSTRGELQRVGLDWTRIDEYRALVSEASARVTIPRLGLETQKEWEALISARPKVSRSRFA